MKATALEQLSQSDIAYLHAIEAADDAVQANPEMYSREEGVRRLLASWRLQRRLITEHGYGGRLVSINRINGWMREGGDGRELIGPLSPDLLAEAEPIEAQWKMLERNPRAYSSTETDAMALERLRIWNRVEAELDIDPVEDFGFSCSTGLAYRCRDY